MLKPTGKNLPALHVLQLQEEMTEAEQLKALSDIYPEISKMKGFNDNNHWGSDAPAWMVLHHTISQMERLFKQSGKFHTWALKRDARGYYILAQGWRLNSHVGHFIPLNWMPRIKKTHPRLHSFMIYAVRLAHQYSGIDLYESMVKYGPSQNQHGYHYDYLLNNAEELATAEEDLDFEHEIRKTLNDFSYGSVPQKYLREFASRNVSLKKFRAEVEKFIPENELETIAEPMFRAVLELASCKLKIQDVEPSRDESEDEETWDLLHPSDTQLFVWDNDTSKCHMMRTFYEHCEAIAHGYGMCGIPQNYLIGRGREKENKHQQFVDRWMDFLTISLSVCETLDEKTDGRLIVTI